MKRGLFVLCVVALSAVGGWMLRGAHDAEQTARCGACFGCRAGYATFCESLEREGFGRAVCNPEPRGAAR